MELDLEKQYSPSLFTKRFRNATKPNEEVINNFINVSAEGNNKINSKAIVIIGGF